MLCERCGSINIVRARSRVIDRLVGVFTEKQRFVCNRCGWKAWRAWDDSNQSPWQLPRRSTADTNEIEFDIDRHD